MFPAIILFLARFQGRHMLTGEKVSSFSLRSEPLVSELIKAEHGFNCSYFHCIGVHTIQTLELTLNGFLFISSCASLNCVGHLIYNFDRIQFNLLQERISPHLLLFPCRRISEFISCPLYLLSLIGLNIHND